MGTSLTGLTPAATYDGLLKTTDNESIGATEKVVTDGLGNNSALKVGTASASVQGGFQVTGTLKDSSGDVGTSGQFLSSTATGTNWVDVSIPAGVFEAGSGTDSIEAVGGSATASGDYSFAMGKNTTASGAYSFAGGGSYTTASGDYSVALSGGNASGGLSFAALTGAAQGNCSIAIGYASRAGDSDGGSSYGDGQIAIGTNSYAYGQFGMALGSAAFGNTTASGDSGIALGGYGTASGNYSIAIQGIASGDSSVAINGGTASGYYSVAIKTGLSSCSAYGEQTFVIGNGGQTTALSAFAGVINAGIANHQNVVCIQANSNRDSAVFVNELSIMSIPTSAAGLPTGAVWRNGTVLNIVA
jgi:trimeric autotransporter adhesin